MALGFLRFACCFLALTLFLPAAPAASRAQNDPAAAKSQAAPDRVPRMTIEVTGGPGNKPVENASVYLKYVEERTLRKDKKYELNVKTNREGVARIPDPPLGKVLIQIVAEGWKTYGRWYDITDQKQVIKIHLEKPPRWY